MDDSRLNNINGLREFLESSKTLVINIDSIDDKYAFIQGVVILNIEPAGFNMACHVPFVFYGLPYETLVKYGAETCLRRQVGSSCPEYSRGNLLISATKLTGSCL